MYAANHFPGVKAIISLTESGHTPLIMSRIRSGVPIYSYTRHPGTQRRAAMFRGVYTVPFDAAGIDPALVSDQAIDKLKEQSLLKKGDWIILTKGDFYSNSRSEEHTSEIQSLMRISYADSFLNKKNKKKIH